MKKVLVLLVACGSIAAMQQEANKSKRNTKVEETIKMDGFATPATTRFRPAGATASELFLRTAINEGIYHYKNRYNNELKGSVKESNNKK